MIFQELFPGISDVCKKCNTCCKTYGWLLKKEAKDFIQRGYPVVQLNHSIFCVNSFKKDTEGKLILDEIPVCRFYGKRECLIQKDKPLDCKLFPVKLKFQGESCFLGLSLGCKYISRLNEKEKELLYSRVKKGMNNFPKKDLDEYFNLMYKVSLISKPKKFWMKRLITFKKRGNSWELISFHD